MEKFRFLRNYRDYKIGTTYDNVDLKDEEITSLEKNGTIVKVKIANDEILPKKVTVALIKESYPKVYEQIIKEGKDSRNDEVMALNKSLEEVTVELEALKKGSE